AGKQFGDRRSPYLYAWGPRRPAGVGQNDLYWDLSRHSRTCGDIAKVITSRCCGSDGRKNRRLVARRRPAASSCVLPKAHVTHLSVLPLDRTAHGWKLLFGPMACFSDLLHGFK